MKEVVDIPVPATPSAPQQRRWNSPLLPLLWLLPLVGGLTLLVQPLTHLQMSIIVETGFRSTNRVVPGEAWLPLMEGVIQCSSFMLLGGGILLSLYLAWSPGRFWLRLVVYWLIAGLFVGLYHAGASRKELFVAMLRRGADPYLSSPFADSSLASLCLLPMLMLAMQLPFWSLRMLCGCRLEKTCDGRESLQQLQGFSIFDLLLATAIVAGSLGLLQFGFRQLPTAVTDSYFVLGDEWFLYWAMHLLITSLVAASLVCLTLTFLFLKNVRLMIAWGIAIAEAIALSVILHISGIYDEGMDRWRAMRESLLVAFTVLGLCSIGLTLLRVSGWRLITRWSKGISER